MITPEEYNKLYPDGCFFLQHKEKQTPYQPIILVEGMLVFTEETAHWWAGPFAGNTAYFCLSDWSQCLYGGRKNNPNYNRLVLDVWDENYKRYQDREARRAPYKETPYSKAPVYLPIHDQVTKEKPIKLYLCGNDDTSYSKFYVTREEAMEEFELFSNNEPLHAGELINDFNFIFTN